MTNPDTTFGQRLRQLRQEKQVRQGELAERFAISPAYLSDIERGKRNPPADSVIRQWAGLLDLGEADELGDELVELAARDRGQAVNETVKVVVGGDGGAPPQKAAPGSGTPFIDHFGTDLTGQAVDRLPPAEERRGVCGAAFDALRRLRRNSVALSAPSSADGARALYGLARALAAGEAPAPLAGRRLMSIAAIQAGVKYRGQLEERVNALLSEAEASGTLLHFFSLADIVQLEETVNGSYFVPALLEGRVQILTGARPDQWAYCRRANPGLAEAFQSVEVPPPDSAALRRGLFSEGPRYAAHHGVAFSDEALEAVAETVGEDDGAWQRALDLLDRAGIEYGRPGSAPTLGAAEIQALKAS